MRAQGAKPSISGLVVKPGSALRKAHAAAPKHEKDKGDFLLKMGLVSRGGVVRVWVPDPPSKGAKATAAGEAATASSAAASRPGGKFVVLNRTFIPTCSKHQRRGGFEYNMLYFYM